MLQRRSTRTRLAVLAVCGSLSLAVTACGDDGGTSGSSGSGDVAAVIKGDLAMARSHFADDLEARCPASVFGTRTREALWWGTTERRDDWHVRLLETATLSDGRVRVRVRVERTGASPPFEVTSMTSEHAFVLVFEDGAWRIDAFDWPRACF